MLALRRRVRAVRKPKATRTANPGPVRYWDPHRVKRVSKLSPGQSYVSTTDELLVTVVGQTVGVSLRDPVAGVVALGNLVTSTHGMPALEDTARRAAHRYLEQELEALYDKVRASGARPEHLEVTLVGGAASSSPGPVSETLEICRQFFAQRMITTQAEFLGSDCSKKIYTSLRDAQPDIILLEEVSETVTQREQHYAQTIQLEHLLGARKTTMNFS